MIPEDRVHEYSGQAIQKSSSIIEAFQKELDQYDGLISLLNVRAAPFITQPDIPPDTVEAIPAAPVHEFQAAVNRLGQLNAIMHNVILRIQA